MKISPRKRAARIAAKSHWWLGLPLLMSACATDDVARTQASSVKIDPDDLLVVDCLLPGQLRKLGQNFTYLTQRPAIKTSAVECEIRGGEYVAYDRASYSTSLKIWLPKAQEGDAEAQSYVGEIYEKGMGVQPDYGLAFQWYQKAAAQGHSRAQINLGYLYESGLGVQRDLVQAMNWYRKASGLPDGELEFVSSIEAAQREGKAAEAVRLQQEVTQLRDETAQLRQQIAQRQTQLKTSESDIARLRKQLEDEKRQAALAVPVATGSAGAAPSSAALEAQLQRAEQERQDLIAQLAQKQASIAELNQARAKADAEIAERNARLETLQQQLASARGELQRIETLETGKQSAEVELIRLQSQTRNLEAEVARQQQKIAALEQDKSATRRALESKLQATGSSEQQLQQQLQDKDRDLAALRAQLEQRDQSVADLERELGSTRDEQGRLNAELQTRQGQIAQLRDDLAAVARDLEQRQLALATTRDELVLAKQAVEREKQLASAVGDSKAAALEARIRELSASLEKQQNEVQRSDSDYQKREAELNGQLQAMQVKERELELTLNARTQEIKSLRSQLDITQKSMVEQNLASTNTIAALEAELQEREAELWKQKKAIEKMQAAAAAQPMTLARNKDVSDFAAVEVPVPVGPTIEIIEPPVAMTRGTPTVLLRSAVPEISIIGRVEPIGELLSFRVNDRPEKIDSRGLFQTRIKMVGPDAPVRAVAVDKNGLRTQLDFVVHSNKPAIPVVEAVAPVKTKTASAGLKFGTYHALVIGNDSYRNLPSLRTARNDARAVAQILETKYGFKTTLLLDADRYMMLSALNQLRKELDENSNLLIYYAGHGELDGKNFRGYWLPVDSESDSSANWISNVAITDILNVMAARHVLVVADSCYSGTLTRSSLARLDTGMTDNKKLKWYEAMAKVKARLVLSSGGVQPVLDSGGGQHSVFAKAFLDVLRENDGILEGFNLYRSIQTRVKNNPATAQIDQDPQYAPIKFAGHEAGEFLFPPVSEAETALQLPDAWHLMFAKTETSMMQQVPVDALR